MNPGDEIGQAGANDPDSRRVQPAESELNDHQKSVRALVQELAALRRCSAALRRGDRLALEVAPHGYAYARDAGGGETALIVINTSTDADSFKASSGLTVGRDDGCGAGGGAQLITLGGMNFPSDLQVYGGQLVAAGDVDFEARANGIEGISIVAGGEIDGTSFMNMGFCGGDGLENNFMAEYFRLAV